MSTSSARTAGWAFGHRWPFIRHSDPFAGHAEPFARQAEHLARHAEHFARAAGRHRGHPRHGHGPFGPRAGGFFGPPFFGGGRRAARGDIRAAILALLLEEPMHGYQIIQELERRTDGAWRPSPGSVYPTLQQLEDEGLVRSVESEGGRRAFTLTDAGRAAAEGSGSAPWEEVAGSVDEAHLSLRDLVVQVATATWQVAQSGTRQQTAAAQEILRDARRRLYRLLAEDAPVDDGE